MLWPLRPVAEKEARQILRVPQIARVADTTLLRCLHFCHGSYSLLRLSSGDVAAMLRRHLRRATPSSAVRTILARWIDRVFTVSLLQKA